MKSPELYQATVGGLLRENARLRARIDELQENIRKLELEKKSTQDSRRAVLSALDIKGRLLSMINRRKQ